MCLSNQRNGLKWINWQIIEHLLLFWSVQASVIHSQAGVHGVAPALEPLCSFKVRCPQLITWEGPKKMEKFTKRIFSRSLSHFLRTKKLIPLQLNFSFISCAKLRCLTEVMRQSPARCKTGTTPACSAGWWRSHFLSQELPSHHGILSVSTIYHDGIIDHTITDEIVEMSVWYHQCISTISMMLYSSYFGVHSGVVSACC